MTKPLTDGECRAIVESLRDNELPPAYSVDEYDIAIVRAAHAAGFEAGRAAVPREPTEAMMQAAYELWNARDGAGKPMSAAAAIRARWQAMHDAATGQINESGGANGELGEGSGPERERSDKLSARANAAVVPSPLSPSSAAPDAAGLIAKKPATDEQIAWCDESYLRWAGDINVENEGDVFAMLTNSWPSVRSRIAANAATVERLTRERDEAKAEAEKYAARMQKLLLMASHDEICFGGFVYNPNDREFKKVSICAMCNDEFGWACADCEEIPMEEADLLFDLWQRFEHAGVVAWVSNVRGHKPITGTQKEAKFKDACAWLAAREGEGE